MVEPFLEILKPLHESLNRGCTTLMESAFYQSFSADLKEAEVLPSKDVSLKRQQELCNKYRQTSNIAYLNQAWSFYYQTFKVLSLQLAGMKVRVVVFFFCFCGCAIHPGSRQ